MRVQGNMQSPHESELDALRERVAELEVKLQHHVDAGAAQLMYSRQQSDVASTTLAAVNSRLQRLNHDLSHSRDVLRTIFDGLDDALALVDYERIILAANQAFARLHNGVPVQLVGCSIDTLCEATQSLVERTFQDRAAQRQSTRWTSKAGQSAMLEMRAFPLFDGEQQVEHVMIHIVDVTERLQLEAMALQNERLAASGRLAALVAHEVNTPLQSVQNFLYLTATANAQERNVYLEGARNELERIDTIIRRLVDFHRVGADPESALDFNTLLERALLLTSSALTKRRISVERELMPNLPLFWGHSDHLTQVLLNLIGNAIEAMPNGGTLRISTKVRSMVGQYPPVTPSFGVADSAAGAQRLLIEVYDSGQGMLPDVQANIFSPFFSTRSEGAGLGLAISQQIVRQHGGYISVQSRPGEGSCFTITLPIAGQTSSID